MFPFVFVCYVLGIGDRLNNCVSDILSFKCVFVCVMLCVMIIVLSGCVM